MPKGMLKGFEKTIFYSQKMLFYKLIRIEEQITPTQLMQLIQEMNILQTELINL